jgi:hypothetical protein
MFFGKDIMTLLHGIIHLSVNDKYPFSGRFKKTYKKKLTNDMISIIDDTLS